MPSLFFLRCSPRPTSVSSAAAEHFLAALRRRRDDWAVDTLDLWQETLPDIDAALLAARYATRAGRPLAEPERVAYATIGRLLARLARADRILIATPMWNYALPYKLKHFLDLIIQPGLAFDADPARGLVPRLSDRPTLVILASGGDYLTGSDQGLADLATPYLRQILAFIGLRDLTLIPLAPTQSARARAHQQLDTIATTF